MEDTKIQNANYDECKKKVTQGFSSEAERWGQTYMTVSYKKISSGAQQPRPSKGGTDLFIKQRKYRPKLDPFLSETSSFPFCKEKLQELETRGLLGLLEPLLAFDGL